LPSAVTDYLLFSIFVLSNFPTWFPDEHSVLECMLEVFVSCARMDEWRVWCFISWHDVDNAGSLERILSCWVSSAIT